MHILSINILLGLEIFEKGGGLRISVCGGGGVRFFSGRVKFKLFLEELRSWKGVRFSSSDRDFAVAVKILSWRGGIG